MTTQEGVNGNSPSFAELFTPKLVTVWREGYGMGHFRRDAVAGLTVAIVALPLSMAIAIASGVSPAQGLYTAIVGGFLVSMLSGSRFQIGGPAGAFIVLVAATVAQHGVEGLILATLLSGIMLAAAGFLRLGTFIKYIPYPVTVGFMAGIALIILASQIRDFLGLSIAEEPGEFLEKIVALWGVRETLTPAALGISIGALLLILGIRWWRPKWPALLLAVVLSAAFSALLKLDVATIGSEFGGIPSSLPSPAMPELTAQGVVAVMPAALAFTMLGAIESLLSAVVADGMTGRRHRSNCELVAQGVGNVGAALFGGFCVTGTIARTATNIRSGGHGPIAGMLHSLFLLAFMLVAAPLAAYIPLSALAAVLVVVAWNMIDKSAVRILLRTGRGEAAVFAVTFLLTVFRGLTEAILVGVLMGALLFMHRMSQRVEVETHAPLVGRDRRDRGPDEPYQGSEARRDDVVIYRITGVLFFGAAASIGSVLDQIHDRHRALIVDFSAVPFLDSTGANMLEQLADKSRRKGVTLWLTGGNPAVRRVLDIHDLEQAHVTCVDTVDAALAALDAGEEAV